VLVGLRNPWCLIALALGVSKNTSAKVKCKNGDAVVSLDRSTTKQLYYLCKIRDRAIVEGPVVRFPPNLVEVKTRDAMRGRSLEMIGYAYQYGLKIEDFDPLHYLVHVDELTSIVTPKDGGIGIIGEVFRDDVYGRAANYFGKTVVDVGAYIGETAIYFSRKGAGLIYAFEPDTSSFELALENLERNHVKNVNLSSTSVGKNLGEILNRVGPIGLLKMDCEGCEQEAIASVSSKSLDAVEEVVIEYHGDPKPIAAHLESCGFEVRVQRPWTYMNGREIGFLSGKRKTA
jgi:hypothetical protein